MLKAKMSKVMIIGMVLSMLALVAAWPVLAQDPSASAGVVEREQLQIISNQLAASGYTLGSNVDQGAAMAAAPSALPVTGAARAILPASDAPGAREQSEIVAYELAASGVQFDVMSSPGVLPATGGGTDQVPPFLGPQVPSMSDTSSNAVMDAIMGLVPAEPAQLPVTGAQPNPYLELLEQYRQMYGGY